MAFGDLYRVGTISVAAGSTTVTGAGTLWAAGVTPLMAGDTLNASGQLAIIKSVDSSTALTLASPWTGGTLAGAAYAVRMDSPKRWTTKALAENTARLVERSMRLDRAVGTFRCQAVMSNAPPAAPADGDTYLLGMGPNGVWTGYAGQFATWTGTGWAFTAAEEADQAYSVADGAFFVRHNGVWSTTTPTLGRGGNLLANADASAGAARVSFFLGANTSGNTIQVLGQAEWVPDGIDGFAMLQSTGVADNYSWAEFRPAVGNRFPVEAGKYYEFSAYTVNRVCADVYIDLQWYDTSGSLMGSANCYGASSLPTGGVVAYSGGNPASSGPGGKSIGASKRLWFIARAPDGAVSATPRFIKSGTSAGGGSCLAMAWWPFLAEARATQTEPTPWSCGPRVHILPGAIGQFAMPSPPAGWVKANGAALSRAVYSDLFGAIGTTWGSGDGATTFNVPDFRGEFVRGWDDGRGVDAGRAFAAAQAANMPPHQHRLPMGFDASYMYAWRDASNGPIFGSSVVGGTQRSLGSVTADGGNVRLAYSDSELVNATGELRPRNLAPLICIKH